MTPAPDAAASEPDRGPLRPAPAEPTGQVPPAAPTAYGSSRSLVTACRGLLALPLRGGVGSDRVSRGSGRRPRIVVALRQVGRRFTTATTAT